jgi:nucleotide-binding universal stress UspA family protein
MEKIIATIDFSSISDDVVKASAELAKAFDATLYLLHTELSENAYAMNMAPQSFADPGIAMGVGTGVGMPVEDYISQAESPDQIRVDQQRLEAIKSELSKQSIKVECLVIQGELEETVLDQVHALNADMVVMGSRKHGIFHNLLFGSKSQDFIDESPCPVLIVPESVK